MEFTQREPHTGRGRTSQVTPYSISDSHLHGANAVPQNAHHVPPSSLG